MADDGPVSEMISRSGTLQCFQRYWSIPTHGAGQAEAKMRLLILIILIVLLLGALPTWPYSAGWGYYPAGGLGTILIIILVLALLGVV
jgi:hypothetical protein